MSKAVILDASAILAWLHDEPGAEVVADWLASNTPCLVTAANQAEIIARSLDRGVAPDALREILTSMGYVVTDTLAEDGAQAGWMRTETRQTGLSLGDRLCLAVAQRLKAQVITADRPWLNHAAALDLDIHCIRPDAH